MAAVMKNNREKLLAALTAAIMAGAVTFITIIEPQLKERQAHLERMHDLQLQLTKMRGDLLIKDRIDEIYAQIGTLIVSNGTEQQEKSLFTRELSNLYSRLDVKIRSITILPPMNEEFYTRLAVKIEMSGHIRNILNFIFAAEMHASPIRIEQFDLKTREIFDNIRVSFLITKVVAKVEI
jgi:Tfp pilus assembly protein PilO